MSKKLKGIPMKNLFLSATPKLKGQLEELITLALSSDNYIVDAMQGLSFQMIGISSNSEPKVIVHVLLGIQHDLDRIVTCGDTSMSFTNESIESISDYDKAIVLFLSGIMSVADIETEQARSKLANILSGMFESVTVISKTPCKITNISFEESTFLVIDSNSEHYDLTFTEVIIAALKGKLD